MALVIIVLLLVLIFFMYGKRPLTIKSRPWNHYYDGIQFSANDFYEKIEAGLRERKIQGLNFGKESFLESHIFSAKRVYLRISQAEYVFFVCAAPFGTGTFVSWWLCVKNERFINRIPLLSKMAGKDRNNKTFYQMDTEAMYQSAVHSTVIDVADGMTSEKGIRLSDLERTYKSGS